MPAAESARSSRWRARWRRFARWINGRKRFQGGVRAAMPVVEDDGARLKFNPFANVSREEIAAIYARAELPPHPLAASGYSVGRLHALHQPDRTG